MPSCRCTQCRELTARWQSDWLCKEHALFCREIIIDTAGFAANLMRLSEEEIRALRFGRIVEQIDGEATGTAVDS